MASRSADAPPRVWAIAPESRWRRVQIAELAKPNGTYYAADVCDSIAKEFHLNVNTAVLYDVASVAAQFGHDSSPATRAAAAKPFELHPMEELTAKRIDDARSSSEG